MVRITADRASVIDELGDLRSALAVDAAEYAAKVSVRQARAAALEAAVLGWYDGEPPEAEAAPAGEKYVAEIGPKGNRSSIISISRLYRRLGRVAFMANAEIPLGKLRTLLGKEEISKFIATERTGARSLRLSPRP